MSEIPLVDLKAQYVAIKPEIDVAIKRVLDNSAFILGQEVADFESAFARYVGVAGAVGVASGTAALYLALVAIGVGAGDEVITTSHTFIATAEAIVMTGARPVFVDIDEKSYNLDPQLVEDAITPQTRAIIPVHLYGQPADMDPLVEIAQRKDLWLIEDAAQAHGAEYKGKLCGSFGHLACFSFYPGKNLGAYGDAGAVTGSDPSLLARVRKLRDHGRTSKYLHDEFGYGERLDALQAAVLSVKLKYLDEWTTRRRAHAETYHRNLTGCELVLPTTAGETKPAYHLYVVRTALRDELAAHLKARGIQTGIHYPTPLHHQPAYVRHGFTELHLPITERVANEVLSLPLYPELAQNEVERVCQKVIEFLEGRRVQGASA